MELKMSKTWKRVISFVLAFAMAFSFTPSVTSRAAAPDENVVVEDATPADAEAFEVDTQTVDAPAEAEEFEVETQEVGNTGLVYRDYKVGTDKNGDARTYRVTWKANSSINEDKNTGDLVFTLGEPLSTNNLDVYSGVLNSIDSITIGGTPATVYFKPDAWNIRDGAAAQSTPGVYKVKIYATNATEADGETEILPNTVYTNDEIEIEYTLLGAPVDTTKFMIDDKSLHADWYEQVYEDDLDGNKVKTRVAYGANGNTLDDISDLYGTDIWYTVDTVKDMVPTVYDYSTGTWTEVNSDRIQLYYFPRFKATGGDSEAYTKYMTLTNNNTNYQGAMDGTDLKSDLKSLVSTDKPNYVGQSWVLAIVKESADKKQCATLLKPGVFEVAPVTVFVKPAADQSKVYGEAEGDLAYTVYKEDRTADLTTGVTGTYKTYSDLYGVFTADPDADDDLYENGVNKLDGKSVYTNPVKVRAEMNDFIKTYDDALKAGVTTYANTKIENGIYDNIKSEKGVDTAEIPLLTRRSTASLANEAAEQVGQYPITTNATTLVNGNGQVGKYYVVLLDKTVKFTINKRPLDKKKIGFYTDDETVTETDPLKKATSDTYTKEYKDNTVYYPGIVVKDNIQKPVFKTKANPAFNDGAPEDPTTNPKTLFDGFTLKNNRVEYKAEDVIVDGRDSKIHNTLKWNGTDVALECPNNNFTIEGTAPQSGEPGKHDFTLLATEVGNYTGSLDGSWTIGNSSNSYVIDRYLAVQGTTYTDQTAFDDTAIVGTGWDTYYTNTKDGVVSAATFDDDVLEVPYTGKAYKLVIPKVVNYKDASGNTKKLPANVNAKITYTDASDPYEFLTGDQLKTYPTDAPARKNSEEQLEFINAGTYKIKYTVASVGSYTGVVDKEITLTIKKATFNYKVENTQLKVFDADYVVQAKAEVANSNNLVQAYYTDENDKPVKVTADKVAFWYSTDESNLEKRGDYDLKADLIDDEIIEKMVDDAHAKAYECKVDATLHDVSTNPGVSTPIWVGDNVRGLNLSVDYSDLAKINAVLKAAKQPEIEKEPDVRSWDALTKDQKDALKKADITALKIKYFKNRNYSIDPTPGTAMVEAVELPLKVYVHKASAWDATKSVWKDFNYETGASLEGYTPSPTKEHWSYGNYSAVPNKVEVYLDYAGASDFDYVDNVRPLPEKVAEGLTYSFYKNGDSYESTLGAAKNGVVKQDELESVLDGLKAGTYNVRAIANPADIGNDVVIYKYANSKDNLLAGDTTERLVKVTPGELEIKSAVGGKVPVSETFPGLKEEAGSIVVMIKDGSTPITESDDTIALWYAPKTATGNFSAAGTAATEFGDDVAPENNAWKLAKDVKFATKGEYKMWVIAVPVAATKGSMTKSAAKEVTITATAARHGDNDIVADIIMSHTKDDGGKVVRVAEPAGNASAQADGTFSKTYGEYTVNKKKANGTYEMDDQGLFTPEKKDNVIEYKRGIVEYVTNELLSNNEYAVGMQNTGLYWGKNAKGEAAIYRYADAKKIAFNPIGLDAGEYDNKDNYVVEDIAADGSIVNEALEEAMQAGRKNSAELDGYANGFANANDRRYYVLDGGKYQLGNDLNPGNAVTIVTPTAVDNQADTTAKKLIDGIELSVKLLEDDNKILAYTTTGSGENMKQDPKIGIKNGNLEYTLAKNTEGGTAKLEVTVARANFDEITFNVTIAVDADAPIISVQSNAINKESSTSVVANTKFTDKFVNRAPEFSITIDGAKEDGKFYYWSKEILSEKDVKNATKITQLMWQPLTTDTIQCPEEDGEYILYVKAVDDAGNESYASSKTAFTLDSKDPVIANSSDTTIIYKEELSSIILDKETDKALLKVTDASLAKVEAKLGDGEPTEIKPNANNNYELAANADTYTIIATDAAGNSVSAKIDVNLKVDNTKNDITLTYDGSVIDVATLVDPADPEKKLFTKSANAGAESYADETETKKTDSEDYKHEIAVRGAGTMDGSKLTVTKAGTFAITMTTEKKDIYGKTETTAFLTVNKAERQVSIKLVKDPSAETKETKEEFTKTEAGNIKDYVDLVFEKGGKTDDSVVTYTYYKGDEKLVSAPEIAGDYAVSVAIAEDDLYYATDSLNASENKKAAYKIVDTKKIKINNEAEKGTVKVTDATGAEIADLEKVAKGTAVVITVEAANGYDFLNWDVKSGATLEDATKAEIKVTVGDEDIELAPVYAEGITITKQPESATVKAEQTATFTVEATGNGEDDLTYQWYRKTKNESFVEIADATAASYTTSKQTADNNGDQYKVRVTSKSTKKYKDSEVATVEVTSLSLEGAVITLEKDSVPYNGQTQAPKITKVMLGDVEVTAQDYEVSTDDYVDVKEYTVTITGKGDYTGTASTKYTITKAVVTVEAGTAKLTDRVYDGTVDMAVEGALEVKGIPAGADIKVNALPETVKVEDKNAGEKTYVFKVKLEGEDADNVDLGTESIELKGTIAKKGVTLEDMKFNNKYYDGSKYMILTTQEGTIKEGLVKGDDVKFTTKQANWVITGTKSAGNKRRALTRGCWNVTGKDAANYKLAKGPVATGTIKKVVVKKVTLKATSVKYNGKAQKPVIKAITGSEGKKILQKNCKIEYLRNGKATADFKSKGKITVKVTGVGTKETGSNWKGTVSVTYTIK